MNRALLGATASGLSEPGINCNKEVLHTQQKSRTVVSPLDAVKYNLQDTHFVAVLPLCRGYNQIILQHFIK